MTWTTMVPDGDGVKKLCAWVKNAAGLVSVISPAAGTADVDMDTIQYANSSPPQVTSFSVTNPSDGSTSFAAGDLVKISWTVTDSLGLDNNPITLEYTTNGTTWTTIESAYGNLTGNPTSYTYDYYGFNAPSSGFTRVRIKGKNVTGQYSNTVLSQALNGGRWSIYAGNKDRGVGASAKSLLLYKSSSTHGFYAVSPKTNDIYVIDDSNAVIKIDGRTGLSSTFLVYGITNFVDGGIMTPGASRARPASVAFDSNGYLYVVVWGTDANTSSVVWQIDPSTNITRRYIGCETCSGYDNTATPSTVFVSWGQVAFDESNSLYFFASCTNPFTTTSARRLMKVTQVNGLAKTVSVVAGNCVKELPTSGTVATNTGVSNFANNLSVYSLAVWNNGGNIYFTVSTEKPVKIVNGVTYTTALPAPTGNMGTFGFLTYSPVTGKIYRAMNSVEEWTPSTGTNGETSSTFVSSAGTGNCSEDGALASNSCVTAAFGVVTSPQGKILFTDNMSNAGGTGFRVRYVDDQSKVRTLFGSPGHYGEGLDKSLARSNFGGIYYKKASEANQAAFPEGLYFKSYSGAVFGRIETNGLLSTLWGNQSGATLGTYYPTGTSISPYLSMGANDNNSLYQSLTFDSSGLPWLPYQKYLVSIDSSNKVVVRTSSVSSTYEWSYQSPSVLPASIALYSGSSLAQNLTTKGEGAFLFGRFNNGTANFSNVDPVMRFYNFLSNTTSHIMGGNGSTTMSADSSVAGSVANFNFGPTCTALNCAMQYDSANDILYFSDGAALRALSSPTTPASNLLSTLFTASSTIANFILSMDNSQVFYVMGGRLYCHAISAGGVKSWCNDTSLGPTTGLSTIAKGPNQLTWKDSQTLLINTYSTPAEIYQYDLPTIP